MAEPSRRRGHRLRRLAGPQRWVVVGTLAAFGLAPFLAAGGTLSAGWQATGDVAVIGLRSRDAWTTNPPLLGLTTTGQELTGRPANHPGPIEFWILGLTTRVLGGRAGLVVGAALINASCLVGIAWLAFRRGGAVLLALTSVALAGLIRSLSSASLHDAFNPELTTFPMLLTLLAAWCVVEGDLRIAPLLIAAASLASQIHLAGAGFVGPLVVIGLCSIWLAWRRHPRTVHREAAFLLGAGGLAIVLWSPVIFQELSSQPSNIAALWRVATVPRSAIGLSSMTERLSFALAPPPSFLRSTGRLGFVADTSPLGLYLAALLLGATASLGLLVRRRTGRRDILHLATLSLAATAAALWLGSRQPPLAAFRADGTRWLWVASLLTWVVVAWAAWHLLHPALQVRVQPFVIGTAAAVTVALLAVALSATKLTDQRDGRLMAATDEAASEAVRAVPKGTYHLLFEGNQALITIGPGVAYRLEVAGSHVRVDDNLFGHAYGSQRTRPGPVDGELRITSGPAGKRSPAEALVANVGIEGGRNGTIRIYMER